MKFIVIISLIIYTSISSFSQLNFGTELTQTTNKFLNSNLITPVSNKLIIFLNYKFNNSVIEMYYADDILTTSAIQYGYYDYGFMYGAHKKYTKSITSFTTMIGLYNRKYTNENIVFNFGNKIGITGKIQFGFKINEGLNTGITYRAFQDVFNLNNNQNQLLLNQSSFCFTMEINLFRAYSIISNKFKQKERKKRRKKLKT